MLNEALKVILTVVVGLGLRWVLTAIGVEIDPALFDTIVAGIVLWILVHLGLETAKHFAPKYFK